MQTMLIRTATVYTQLYTVIYTAIAVLNWTESAYMNPVGQTMMARPRLPLQRWVWLCTRTMCYFRKLVG